MNKKTSKLVLLILLLSFFTTFSINDAFYPENTASRFSAPFFIDMSFVSNPITINGNIQLATWASSGDGSSTNPYIIENYFINGCNFNISGVSIQNTNKYFILQNITVSYCYDGFYFNNVTFGIIINSIATNNNYTGFELDFSSNHNILANNTAANNSFGYFFHSSNNNANVLVNNTASNNYNDGFALSVSSYDVLVNNTANNNYNDGFALSDTSSSNILNNNTATNNTYNGFALYSSNNNTLVNNTASKNSNSGFVLDSSNSNNLTSNTAINNIYGFYLNFSSYNILKDNIGQYNQLYDYYAVDSPNTLLSNNVFIKSNSSTIPVSTTIINPISFVGPCIGCGPVQQQSPSSPLNVDLTSFFNEQNLLLTTSIITLGLVIFLYFRRRLVDKPVDSIKTIKQNTNYKSGSNSLQSHSLRYEFKKIPPINDTSPALTLIEDILKESYQVSDYETALKILHHELMNASPKSDPSTALILVEDMLKETGQVPNYESALKVLQGGFPDYNTFKQASNKGVTTYAEWIINQKEEQNI